MKRRTVAIIGTRGYPSYYGGFETAVRKLAPTLVDAGWDVVVYGRPGQIKLDDPDLDPRVRVVTTRGVDSTALSTLTFGLTACLHAFFHRPHVALVMNCANGYWLPLLRLRRVPIVLNVDGIEWERQKWGPWAKRIFRWGAVLSGRMAHSLVFDAHAIGDYWRRTFRRDGYFIPYGGQPVGELPVEPGFTSGGYVLIVARFVPENTINEFLTAAETIAEHHPVILVGTSGAGNEIDARAERLDATHPNIHWMRHISDDRRLFALWQHAGVYFHGHSVGGTNPALVQAMACGARIVARDTVYNREVLADTAVYCAPDPASIASTVLAEMATTDDRGARARERGAAHYNWPDVCAAYEQAISETLGRPRIAWVEAQSRTLDSASSRSPSR
ncbi:glycosyltransferase [Nocardioides sp. TRM66260-LWL]|uniref:glycosyltransferase n=1 Tax=Nocardioides sp. TRM66260-LWL TaxID=2874478 RepID=UPI001CC51166|nr:glycosyltransferase [Nocardioides sp. TRM66260-LWL]MBZ5734948.1 glycosyltransferase [Nocardioides sp. TRM66260-LWL]